MIIGSELGIGYDPDQHAAYAASWIQILDNQPLEIFRAAADGEKIHTYLQTLQQQQSISSEELQADKSEIIKEYDRLVKSPEARRELHKQNPGLVAARDSAVQELPAPKSASRVSPKTRAATNTGAAPINARNKCMGKLTNEFCGGVPGSAGR